MYGVCPVLSMRITSGCSVSHTPVPLACLENGFVCLLIKTYHGYQQVTRPGTACEKSALHNAIWHIYAGTVRTVEGDEARMILLIFAERLGILKEGPWDI